MALWVAYNIVGGALLTWPMSVPLVAFVGLATVDAVVRRPVDYRRKMLYGCSVLFFPLAITVIAVVLNNPDGRARWTNGFGTAAIGLCAILQLITTVYLCIRMTNVRLFTIAVACFALWFLLCASFVGLMSVSGDWL